MNATEVRGHIPALVRNDAGIYEGDLVYYFKIVFENAKNLNNPYHNFRHLCHVMWLCHSACFHYRKFLTQRKMRNLLVAALFHDFDHTGKAGPDLVNINLATQALWKYILPEDWDHVAEIESLIRLSLFPYEIASEQVGLLSQILRDADVAQALNPAWVQQVVFGLAHEWGVKPIEVLKKQEGFHSNIKFVTKWAQEMFPQEVIDAKVAEAREFVELLA